MSGEDVQSLAKFLGTTTQEHIYNKLKESIDYTASIDTGEDLSYTSGQKKMDDFIIEFNERVSDGETPEKRTPTNITIQKNFYGGSQTAADLMQEARYEAERSVLDGLSE